jgi:hypothetical protein
MARDGFTRSLTLTLITSGRASVLSSDENGRIVGIGRMLFADPETANAFNGYVKISASRSVIAYAFIGIIIGDLAKQNFANNLAIERTIG